MVVALDMGYGHLRAAAPLAAAYGTELLHADRAPLADDREQRHWSNAREMYEAVTRLAAMPLLGPPLRSLLAGITYIPHLHPRRDLSKPSSAARMLDRFIRRGLGAGMENQLRESGAPLHTTFYAPAIAADRAGCERVFCVVTDSDINRVWAPMLGARSRIQYLVPSQRARRRLEAYGIAKERITFTGFPLPQSLLGGPDLPVLKRQLAARLVRLDPRGSFRELFREQVAHLLGPLPDAPPRPPHLAFAVGGTGTQAELVRVFLPSLRDAIDAGQLRLTLVAGIRPEVADQFKEAIAESRLEHAIGTGIDILFSQTHAEYLRRFESLIADLDMLWTKPSELTFYAALGLPLIFSWPVGIHERYNRRWAMEAGAGFKQGDPRFAGSRIAEWLADGTLAAAAWSGFSRLPKHGLYRIMEAVSGTAATR
jgi:hypothetical protein